MKPISQVCADWNLHAEMKAPERFLVRHIKAGHFPARKIGRAWFMTPADEAAALEFFAAKPVAQPAPAAGLSARSARMRAAS